MNFLKTALPFLLTFVIGLYSGFYTNPDSFSIYLSTGDVVHVNLRNKSVSFEVQDTIYSYQTNKELFEFIENVTATSSNIDGYSEDLHYLIEQGYICAKTIMNEKEQYTELYYDGPHYGIDATKDVKLWLGTMYTVEELYEPETKSWIVESYNTY
jgi:hypothetical protein